MMLFLTFIIDFAFVYALSFFIPHVEFTSAAIFLTFRTIIQGEKLLPTYVLSHSIHVLSLLFPKIQLNVIHLISKINAIQLFLKGRVL